MKKIFILIIFVFISIFSSKSFASEETFSEFYTTSDGVSFSLDDIVLYYDDLNHEFIGTQEFIDYAYCVGYNRTSEISEKYHIFGKDLTKSEIQLMVNYPQFAKKGYELSNNAIEETRKQFPDSCSDGQLGNSFLHAYWTTLLYFNTSPEFAIKLVMAHEEYDSNPIIHKNMDLYNDQVAYDSCKVYDMMTEDDMIDFSLNLVSAGKLIYIIFGYEYVSQSVYYVETNTTVETKTTADLYAYTNTNIPFNIPKTVYKTVSKAPGGATIRP